MNRLLDGLRVLVLEDEFLIAMDVEQLCRDHGAEDVVIARSVSELLDGHAPEFDAAIVDVMLDGKSTFAFAETLRDRQVPFVFATGYTQAENFAENFPDVPLVGKPYSGEDLIHTLARACGRTGGRHEN